jgi:hypothetical protein
MSIWIPSDFPSIAWIKSLFLYLSGMEKQPRSSNKSLAENYTSLIFAFNFLLHMIIAKGRYRRAVAKWRLARADHVPEPARLDPEREVRA